MKKAWKNSSDPPAPRSRTALFDHLKTPTSRLEPRRFPEKTLPFDLFPEAREIRVSLEGPFCLDGQLHPKPSTRRQNKMRFDTAILIVDQTGTDARRQGKRKPDGLRVAFQTITNLDTEILQGHGADMDRARSLPARTTGLEADPGPMIQEGDLGAASHTV